MYREKCEEFCLPFRISPERHRVLITEFVAWCRRVRWPVEWLGKVGGRHENFLFSRRACRASSRERRRGALANGLVRRPSLSEKFSVGSQEARGRVVSSEVSCYASVVCDLKTREKKTKKSVASVTVERNERRRRRKLLRDDDIFWKSSVCVCVFTSHHTIRITRRRIWRYNNWCFCRVSTVLPLDSYKFFSFCPRGVTNPWCVKPVMKRGHVRLLVVGGRCWWSTSPSSSLGWPSSASEWNQVVGKKVREYEKGRRAMAITMHSHVVEKSSKPTPEDAYAALRTVDSDLLTRTSWTDARLALHQIKKVRSAHNIWAVLYWNNNTNQPSFSLFFLFHISCLQSVYRGLWRRRRNEDINNNGGLRARERKREKQLRPSHRSRA